MHGHGDAAIGPRELGDCAAVECGIDRAQHGGGFQPVQHQPVRAQCHAQLHLTRRCLEAYVAALRQALQHRCDLASHPIVHVQIRAEDAHEKWCAFTGQGLADALDEH